MKNFFSVSLVFNRRVVFLVFLTTFLTYGYPVQAKVTEIIHSNLGLGTQGDSNRYDWIRFPYTIQVSPLLGAILKTPQLLVSKNTSQWLGVKGISIDVGILQIRRFIHRHFHFYPKLGIALNYSRLENKSNLIGGLLYLEPQYNYLAKWEIFPRIGIGVAYNTISSDLSTNSTTSSATASVKNMVQGDLYWDLSFALMGRINITPHWQLSPSIGFHYPPSIAVKGQTEKTNSLTNFVASVAFGYTPNPSSINYPSRGRDKRSRVNIGWLSAAKKFVLSDQRVHSQHQPDQPEDEDNAGKHYYVGGIYGQWSLQVCNNHALTLTTEWIQDGAAKQALQGNALSAASKVSCLGGHEFRWGKLLFGQQIGFYIMNNEALSTSDGFFDFYIRLGIDYKLTDFLLVGTSLKTNIRVPTSQKGSIKLGTDFVDFRISYSF